MLVIDIFDYAALFHVGGSQTPRQRTILFPKPLLIDEQRKACFEAQMAGFRGFQLSAEGVGDSVQFHGVKFVDGLLVQHVVPFYVRAIAPAWWADRSTAVRGGSRAEGQARRSPDRAGFGGRASAS